MVKKFCLFLINFFLFFLLFIILNTINPQPVFAQAVCSNAAPCGTGGPGTCDNSYPGGRDETDWCTRWPGSVCNQCGSGDFPYFRCDYLCPVPSPSPSPSPSCTQTPGSFASYDGCISGGYDRVNYYNCDG